MATDPTPEVEERPRRARRAARAAFASLAMVFAAAGVVLGWLAARSDDGAPGSAHHSVGAEGAASAVDDPSALRLEPVAGTALGWRVAVGTADGETCIEVTGVARDRGFAPAVLSCARERVAAGDWVVRDVGRARGVIGGFVSPDVAAVELLADGVVVERTVPVPRPEREAVAVFGIGTLVPDAADHVVRFVAADGTVLHEEPLAGP